MSRCPRVEVTPVRSLPFRARCRGRAGRTVSLVAVVCLVPVLGVAADAASRRTYVVVLHSWAGDAHAAARRVAASSGDPVGMVYDSAVRGFTIATTPAGAAALERDPAVQEVEPDLPATIAAQEIPNGVARTHAAGNPSLSINSSDDVRTDVDVAVLDTGIDLHHPDLVVAGGVDCTSAAGCVQGGDDDGVHGTHVAGIIGALDNGFGVVGVAPGARLWSVKVLDAVGSGTLSSVLRGLDWVRTQSATIDVVNMSFTLPGYSQALHDAVQSLVDVGVAVAVAAGNGHVDAAGYSPAAFDNVVTVSAMADFDGKPGGVGAPTCAFDQDDTAADFSNLGTVVDMTAPGACIESTLPTSRGSYGTMSGTSMASPHVAGALALLARASRPTTAAQVQAMVARLLAAGSNEWTDDSGDGAQEPLLDVGTPSLFAAGPAVCAPVSTLGLIGSWRGSDTLAADAGPSLSGSVAYTPAVTAHGMLFDETSIATTPSLPAVGTAVSVEMWVEPARVPPIGRIEVLASRWAPGPDDSTRSFALMFDPRGRLLWTVDDTSTRRPDELEVEAPTLSDGAFHHVAATWDGSLMAVYVDGVLAGTAKGRGGRLNATVGIAFRVGGKQGGGAAPFAGIIDDPSAWARALTGGEIASIAAAGAGGRCP